MFSAVFLTGPLTVGPFEADPGLAVASLELPIGARVVGAFEDDGWLAMTSVVFLIGASSADASETNPGLVKVSARVLAKSSTVMLGSAVECPLVTVGKDLSVGV